MSNVFGERLRVVTFGESHGPAVGCVVDGCPAGLPLRDRDFAAMLARDVPISAIGTPRKEPNRARIISGVADGRTLGTPIAIVIPNEDVESEGYERRRDIPRPGHAELTYLKRYGHIDWRGGGRASGRECIARLAAAVIAKRLLATRRVSVSTHVTEMAGVAVAGPGDLERAVERVLEAGARGDSTGGAFHVRARGLDAGLGAPVFRKLSAVLGQALFSIGGVKAIDIGNGRAAASMTGSRNNDPLTMRNGRARPGSNRSGGLLGGITTGEPLEVAVWVKPTPSVAIAQRSVELRSGRPVSLAVDGRFDLNITPRVAVVAEAMVSLVLADALIEAGCIHPTRLEVPQTSRQTA
ncbi:MAG: chorismate synthase [Planctomycetota bacterium]|jgi:chorismate synthase